MSTSVGKRILVLHVAAAPEPELLAVAQAMRNLGADVVVRALDGHYGDILDEVERANAVVCWRGNGTG